MTCTELEPTTEFAPPTDPDTARIADRARRRHYEARAAMRLNRELNLVAAMLQIAHEYAGCVLDEHPDGCGCGACKLVPADDLRHLRAVLVAAQVTAGMHADAIAQEVPHTDAATDAGDALTYGDTLRVLARESDEIDRQQDEEAAGGADAVILIPAREVLE